MKIAVPDMTCGGCAAAIERAVGQVDPQAKVQVDLTSKIVTIESQEPVERLVGIIAAAGFAPLAVAS